MFALECLRDFRQSVPAATVVIVVPTVALLDQWLEELMDFLGSSRDDICVLTGRSRIRISRINIGVINTVAKLSTARIDFPVFLIIDECHRAASSEFSNVFALPTEASLGLSATPERQYDDGLNSVLIPSLGPVIYTYSYKEALQDGVIVDFALINVVFDLADDEAKEYNRLTRAIQKAGETEGWESQKAIALMLKRTRVLNLSLNRIRIAIKLISKNLESRILVFHEDLQACKLIAHILKENGVNCRQYHSAMRLWDRVQALSDFRKGRCNVLVTCRALDEGFNVPETEIGIIAASTASRRQRIQRLGRILRPAPGKSAALIYSLVASTPEIRRLAAEETEMEGMVEVTWTRA